MREELNESWLLFFITVPSNETLEKGFEKILQATLPTSGYLCIINHFYMKIVHTRFDMLGKGIKKEELTLI